MFSRKYKHDSQGNRGFCLLFVMLAYCCCTFVSIRFVSDLSKCIHEASVLAVSGVDIVTCYITQHQFKVV